MQNKFKKYLFISSIAASLVFAAPADAARCNDGAIITGLDGTTYCWSRVQMNWWSAFAWCDAQGRRLVRLEEECYGRGSTPIEGDGCPNFGGNASDRGFPTWMNFWTANTSVLSDQAYGVGHLYEMVGTYPKTTLRHALCF